MERIDEVPGLYRFEVVCLREFAQAFADRVQGFVFEEQGMDLARGEPQRIRTFAEDPFISRGQLHHRESPGVSWLVRNRSNAPCGVVGRRSGSTAGDARGRCTYRSTSRYRRGRSGDRTGSRSRVRRLCAGNGCETATAMLLL